MPTLEDVQNMSKYLCDEIFGFFMMVDEYNETADELINAKEVIEETMMTYV